MDRRLADKILLAVEAAWDQGREEIAKRLGLIHQSLLEEESIVSKERRSNEEDFDAEDPDSFKRHQIYEDKEPAAADENSGDVDPQDTER